MGEEVKPTPDEIEEKRLRKVLANPNAGGFELEDAQQRIGAGDALAHDSPGAFVTRAEPQHAAKRKRSYSAR